MPAHEHTSPEQFYTYHDPEGGALHRIEAWEEGTSGRIGYMLWSNKRVEGLEVDPEHRRKGVATGMWNKAQQVAEIKSKVPAPKHSADRTTAGDAWAKSVGGRLPRRKPVEE